MKHNYGLIMTYYTWPITVVNQHPQFWPTQKMKNQSKNQTKE